MFALACVAYLIGHSVAGAGVSLSQLIEGFPSMGRVLDEMFPPALHRLPNVGKALLETFQMAVAGTFFGVILSLPLAVCAARSHAPHISLYYFARVLVSFIRTVPDLVWALLFVVAVGLGPFAGTLTLVLETVGFCSRFFAEAFEEVEKGPEEALRALGASRLGIIVCAVLPGALPSLITSTLFALEKAIRASVVLGIVGAGGIGIELKVAMDMFRFAEASTIILSIFLLVFVVEQISGTIRRRVLAQG
jgi:phosphonate transport system permease protein